MKSRRSNWNQWICSFQLCFKCVEALNIFLSFCRQYYQPWCLLRPFLSRQEKNSCTNTSAPQEPCKTVSAVPPSLQRPTGTALRRTTRGCLQKWEYVLVSCSIILHCFQCNIFVCPSMQRLVVKPDQLIKRRGKLGFVAVDLNLEGVQEWLNSHLMTEITVGLIKVYICIYLDWVLFAIQVF